MRQFAPGKRYSDARFDVVVSEEGKQHEDSTRGGRQHRVQVQPRHRRQYGVGLRWRSGRRIAEFASADEKGLAVNQELLSAVLRAKMRQIGPLSPGD
jgi:hypothetical protein